MKKDVIVAQMSQALMHLANINDKLRKTEEELFEINTKLSHISWRLDQKEKTSDKICVYVKNVSEKKKEEKVSEEK